MVEEGREKELRVTERSESRMVKQNRRGEGEKKRKYRKNRKKGKKENEVKRTEAQGWITPTCKNLAVVKIIQGIGKMSSDTEHLYY